MRRLIVLSAALASVAGCDQPTGQVAANNTMAKVAEPAKKHPTYCFFKNADTKGWSAARDAAGAITVTGQAHIADRRYMGSLAESEVEGDQARLWLTMAPNTTGSGAPGDWWGVKATVPGGGAVATVTVLCGKKTLAELPLKKS